MLNFFVTISPRYHGFPISIYWSGEVTIDMINNIKEARIYTKPIITINVLFIISSYIFTHDNFDLTYIFANNLREQPDS